MTEQKLCPLVDSREGIQIFMDWARKDGWVLSSWHEKIAAKHGVSTEGVIISRPLPV